MLYIYKLLLFLTGIIILYQLICCISINPIENVYWSNIEELCSSTKHNITFPTYKYVSDNKCYTFKTYTCFNIVIDKCYNINENCDGILQLLYSNTIIKKCEQNEPYEIIIQQIIVFFIIIISFISTIGILIYSIISLFVKCVNETR